MTTSAVLALAQQTSSDSGFNVGTLLLFVGGAILLAFFCSIGVIARMRENRLEARRQAERTASQKSATTGTEPPSA